jgi:S-DNA-T family DNA segregation ATPase FtsK/SpoIIIE
VLDPVELLGDRPAPDAAASPTESDLDVLIDAAIRASAELGCTSSVAPWLPPLPSHLPLSSLEPTASTALVAWGLIDLPAAGKQTPLVIDIESGHTWLVAGASRSGRTTAAIAWVTALAARLPTDQLHLWAIDSAAALGSLASLPHCGTVLPAQDTERVASLLDYLEREVARRREQPSPEDPLLLLVIDSWDGLANNRDDRDAAQVIDQLARLASVAASGRLHLFIAGDRALITGRVATFASERIILRLPDPSDFLLIGMSSRSLPRSLPAGRGVRAVDCALVQIAVADSDATAQARSWPAPSRPIRRFEPMPTRVRLDDLRVPTTGPVGLVLGVEAGDLAPVVLTRADMAGPFLVLGASGSGRSTALLLLASQIGERRVAISGSGRSPLAQHAACVQLPRDDQHHAAAMLDSLCNGPDGPPDLFVDDVDLLADGPLTARLETLVGQASAAGHVIAFAAATDAAAAAFRGPLAVARRAKTGVMLWPSSPHDGEVLGLRLPRRTIGTEPPGRGWLAILGRGRRVQLADPGTRGGQPRTEFELSALGERSRE